MDVLLLFDYLPQTLRNIAYRMPLDFRQRGEELRLRVGKPVVAVMDGKLYRVSENGFFSDSGGFIVTRDMMNMCFDSFTKMSPYAFANELSEGYITVEGGHRIGLCGKKSGDGMRDITSVNMRISRSVTGCSDCIFEALLPFENTLVISPPGVGKTTLLRDISRNLSEYGKKVAICDERCEIAACFKGDLQHDVGVNTDVLSGFSVYEGSMMLLRTMSPDIIVADELGTERDYNALCSMTKAGVKVLASVHGRNREDVTERLSRITAFFQNFIVIENTDGIRNVRMDI